MRNLAIYGCGGAGTNVLKQITDLDIDAYYIDTSDSNLKGVKSDHIHLVDDIDGAGKDRSKSNEFFKREQAEEILIKFQPSDSLNVVISSLSGGSGSILAPNIARELIRQGHNTIVIAIDSKHSIKELDNTIKTLKTYKSFSDGLKKSISVFYIENTDRKESDQRAVWFITLLSLLVNRDQTSEFDTSDLHSFLNFDRVTDNTATVGIIDISANETISLTKNTTIASTILMTTDRNSVIKPVIPEYLTTCVVIDPQYKNDDVRIDNILGMLNIIISSLEEELKELQNNKKVNKFKEVVVDGANEDGLVL